MNPRIGGVFLALLVLVAPLATPRSALPDAAAAAAGRPDPILRDRSVGDPSVVRVGDRRVVVATGRQVARAYKDPGRPWRWTADALVGRPAWARSSGDIWAADIARVGPRWVLYYSVPVRGLGTHGRCIGVAVSSRAVGDFRPVGTRPLVCPARAMVPRAADPVVVDDLPANGVIDPSFHTEDGRNFLLYKTDGKPSSIRLLPLNGSGTGVRTNADPAAPSRELVRSQGVVENPVILKRGSTYFLFTSEGDFARCSYLLRWRRSTSLTSWSGAPRGDLLTRESTGGLCGPGGGDVLVEDGYPTIYFHGWVRPGTSIPMPLGFWAWDGKTPATRALYGARLRFVDGVPRVLRYLG